MTIGYGIFSGGLDSILSVRVLMDQGIEVRLLTFVTPFFDADKAMASGRIIGLEPKFVDLTELHLEMLQNPKHGYGRYMNPCIDCHVLMFKQAGEIMTREGGDFLFSGEVLGQRPKSQNRQALQIVAKESGFGQVILRPLSALALPQTRMEEAGLVDRKRLLGFSGRSRKPQMELAAGFGIKDYPAPAGGCLLTDPVFSRRLKELAAHDSPLEARNVELLKWGRHFRLPGGGKLIVGRNKNENDVLEGMARPGDLVLQVCGTPGPVVLLMNHASTDLDLAASINVSYSDAPDREIRQVRIDGLERVMEAQGRAKKEFAGLMI